MSEEGLLTPQSGVRLMTSDYDHLAFGLMIRKFSYTGQKAADSSEQCTLKNVTTRKWENMDFWFVRESPFKVCHCCCRRLLAASYACWAGSSTPAARSTWGMEVKPDITSEGAGPIPASGDVHVCVFLCVSASHLCQRMWPARRSRALHQLSAATAKRLPTTASSPAWSRSTPTGWCGVPMQQPLVPSCLLHNDASVQNYSQGITSVLHKQSRPRTGMFNSAPVSTVGHFAVLGTFTMQLWECWHQLSYHFFNLWMDYRTLLVNDPLRVKKRRFHSALNISQTFSTSLWSESDSVSSPYTCLSILFMSRVTLTWWSCDIRDSHVTLKCEKVPQSAKFSRICGFLCIHRGSDTRLLWRELKNTIFFKQLLVFLVLIFNFFVGPRTNFQWTVAQLGKWGLNRRQTNSTPTTAPVTSLLYKCCCFLENSACVVNVCFLRPLVPSGDVHWVQVNWVGQQASWRYKHAHILNSIWQP